MKRHVLAAIAAVSSVSVFAEKPSPVTIVNTPLPVTASSPLPVTTSSPIPVQDAFARTPAAIRSFPYTVPAGYRLVIETISLATSCSLVPASSAAVVVDGTAALQFSLPMSLAGAAGNSFAATVSARLVLGPGQSVSLTAGCNGASAVVAAPGIYGYLLSVDSPSLAP